VRWQAGWADYFHIRVQCGQHALLFTTVCHGAVKLLVALPKFGCWGHGLFPCARGFDSHFRSPLSQP